MNQKRLLGHTALVGTALAVSLATTAAAAGKWTGRSRLILKSGDSRTLGRIEFMVPLYQTGDSMLFTDLRAQRSSDNSEEGNAGLGYRRIVSDDLLLGGYGFFDRRRSETGHYFNQGTFGAEAMTPDWDLRANVYVAEDDTTTLSATSTNPRFSGTNIVVDEDRRYETALSGFDAEVGYRIINGDGYDVRAYAGGFRFDADGVDPVTGPRGRLELSLDNAFGIEGGRVTFGGEVRDDDMRGTDGFAEVRLEIPLGTPAERPSLSPIERRMTERVRRDPDVVLASGHDRSAEPLRSPDGERIRVLHVDSNAGTNGDGGVDSPYQLLTSADGDTSGADIVLLWSGSTFNGESITLEPGQRLLADDTDLTYRVTTQDGTVTLPSPTGGDQGAEIAGATDAAVTLTGDNEVRGLTISATQSDTFPGHAVFGEPTLSGDVAIRDNRFVDNDGSGVFLEGSDADLHLSVTGNTVENGNGNSEPGLALTDMNGRLTFSGNHVADNPIGTRSIRITGDSALTITGFADNSVAGGSGRFSVRNATFDADPDASGIQAVSGGATQLGTSGNRVFAGGTSSGALALDNVSGRIDYDSLAVFSDGDAVHVRGGNDFTVTADAGHVTAHTGTALDMRETAIDLELASVASINQSGDDISHGVDLQDVNGPLTVGETTVQNTSAAGVNLSDADSRIDLGQVDISSTGGEGISLSNANQVGSFHISGGTITDTDSTGIHIGNVASGTITGVTIDTVLNGDGIMLSNVGDFSDDAGATKDFVIDGVTIDNVGSGAGDEGISIINGEAIRIVDATVSGTGGNALGLGGQGIDVDNATISDFGGNGIRIADSNGSSGDTWGGINVNGGTIDTTGGGFGIVFDDGPGSASGVTITGDGYGVMVYGSGSPAFTRVTLDNLDIDVDHVGVSLNQNGTVGPSSNVTLDDSTIASGTASVDGTGILIEGDVTVDGAGNTVSLQGTGGETACDTTNAGTVTGSIAYNGGNSCP
ncbi:inverse autotransporter beta domain-containing protein [Arhodomonas aquaeolei]|uniref:inverse autotransporter beta domain-containing protein n=2 Tax=Arhodomonas TaxID=2368 RepID=UPI002166C8DA|nr:inverse autotransporter beta domain-containing protein [Arhodomonas aquaeolei]MCS4505060.1 inverse autotransporter beta domain-containing protein [Arhodomonas aquaeolei]